MSDNTQKQDENRLIAERREKLNALREAGNAFPNQFRRDSYAQDLQDQYGDKTKEELAEAGIKVSVAGRIMLNRGAFMVLQDMTGRIQLYVNKESRPFAKSLDLGDIVGVTGVLHKSGKGDLYVDLGEYQLLTKNLRPLPEKHKGLTDTEQRYRQRYVDLITNDDSRRVFEIRSKMVAGIRSYLADRRFVEAETPMLQVIPGGATARPFVTHHNALDMDMYLRIAPELYLKRLVVGGFERVFEINRNFRNEGLSTRHNPEFTMLEFYQAYADYKDLMDLTEDMLRTLAIDVLGSTTLTYQGSEFDLGQPFARISVYDSILKYNPELKPADLDTLDAARATAEKLGIHIKDSFGLGKVQIEIFEETVEHLLQQPTFITEYPAEVSPLARRNDDNDFITDRFEFFMGGREVANGFSELNDSEDQAERFRQQVLDKDAGDDEAMHYDADYINALEYGLPPTAGEGIGIDRLVMFFADCDSIRDVLLFPAMRPLAAK
ncbi:lysine--tRNA ligase [Neptunomonas phycophila]|jgi:lysyl-tRNA synthetase class 2|uniref:Lysine--tRNA ligase n=2 Tax=Neptunomonas phycophila TaxID=1572645 RepID=A0AAW7XMJ6_9GAMM|nr:MULTISPECIES: lysine--tRNA ligase [Neptunomonas]MDN2658457.1 lysine--tRNA ligase [Neptunomonas sp. CHC150]MDO6454284.1 lysine--tRNA ligase [Neptunomonas phycophila]MDO6468799.1 lysine--tRNA ligase [Neptunomonas phycophila]MDP2523130.1 lysine--tRNA ligase [Neptunomonas phycophila]QLE98590.1 lysine--tRNA ligase [Neptunomonas phycophila]